MAQSKSCLISPGEIKERIRKLSDDVAVIIIEIGGTVGDIESLPFFEATRQMRLEEGKENVLLYPSYFGSLYSRFLRV